VSVYRHFDTNYEGSDYVVGDLHGCIRKFSEKLKDIKFGPRVDRMFSVGDLVDRGPDSMSCLYLLNEPWFHSVKGNHEDMMVAALLDGDENSLGMWYLNGGSWSRDVMETGEELKVWARKLRDLPVSMTIKVGEDTVGISHAQPPSSNDWEDVSLDSSEDIMLWGRTKIRGQDTQEVNNVTHTFHGHTVVDSPVRLGNSTFLDTGACYRDDRPLTIIKFAEKGELLV